MARSLVTSPAILLADEPTGNLDSTNGNAIMDIFETLHAQGITIIMITHDPEIAQRAQRVIWLKDGLVDRIEATGRG